MTENWSKSEQISDLVTALATAQGEFDPVFKGNENPAYRGSRYADLATVINATQKHLAKNGLAVIQLPREGLGNGNGDKTLTLTTVLAHKSGQWIASDLTLPAIMQTRFDAQSVGSAITYARRYAYQAIIGVAAEVDDDANAASGIDSKEAAKEVLERKTKEAKAQLASLPSTKFAAPAASQQGADNEKGVSAVKVVEFSTPPEYADSLRLTGSGLATLVSQLDTVDPHFKRTFMHYDGDYWYVIGSKADILADICVSMGLDAKRTPTEAVIASNAQQKPSGEAIANSFPIINSVKLISKGVSNPFVSVEWDGEKLSCFDTHIFDYLERGIGKPADFIIKTNKKNGKTYNNIVGIHSIGSRSYSLDSNGNYAPDRMPNDEIGVATPTY